MRIPDGGLVGAIANMTPAERNAWANDYDRLAASLRRLYGTPWKQARKAAAYIIDCVNPKCHSEKP